MRRVGVLITAMTAAVGMAQAGVGAQSPVHGRNPFSSMTFLPQAPNPLAPPPAPSSESPSATALAAATAQKLAELNAPPPALDCKMVREAAQGIDSAIRKPATTPGGPSLSGRVITMPSCAKK